MKKLIAAAALLLSSTVAFASELPFFAGANIGMNTKEPYVYNLGVNAGYNVMSFAGINAAVEGTYDLGYPKDEPAVGDRNITHTFAINAIPSFAIPGTSLGVYGLGGVGYRINTVGDNFGVYNIGAGVTYSISPSIGVDARYKRTEGIDAGKMATEDKVTVGVKYSF
ncbi:MAG: outer membrane beta-barrel protein [Methylophilaceae bacterium]